MGLHRKRTLSASSHRFRGTAAVVIGVSFGAAAIGAVAVPLAASPASHAAAVSDAQLAKSPGAPAVTTPPKITSVGRPTTSSQQSTRQPSTALPAGVKAGDVVVSTVSLRAGHAAAVSCGAAWHQAFEVSNGPNSTLTECWQVAGSSPTRPTVTVDRAVSASMVTVAFRGVSSYQAIAAHAGLSGVRLSQLAGLTAGDVVVMGEASSVDPAKAQAPVGASLAAQASVPNEIGVSVATATASAATFSATWRVPATTSDAVNGALVLRSAASDLRYQKVEAIGRSMTATAQHANQLSTGLPAGTAYGDLLVSWVETAASATITCPKGWTQPVNATNGKAVRVAACVGWAAPSTSPGATISSGAQASVVTTDYRGISPTAPIDSAVAMAGLTAPSVETTVAAETLALGEGSATVRGVAAAPPKSVLNATVNSGTSQVASATATAGAIGVTAKYTWSTSPASSAAAVGVLAFKPGTWLLGHPVPAPKLIVPPASSPSPTPTRTATSKPPSTPPSSPSSTPPTTPSSTPTSTPPSTPSSTPTVTPTPTPTKTVSKTPTPTPTPTVTPTVTPTRSPTQGPTATATPTVTPTSSPTPTLSPTSPGSPPPSGSAPTTPPAVVCGNAALLSGPTTAPAGAITVTPSEDLETLVSLEPAGTTFWLKGGTYTLGSGQFDQIQPMNNDTFIGAPGAVIDGQHENLYAFTTQASDVTIEYLTIENFGAAGDNEDEGVVNHDSGPGWTLQYDTITNNAGAGTMIGSNNVLRYNCLSDNGQYGFNAYLPSGPDNITLDHNEITGNDTYNWEAKVDGCGCTGGGKFWNVTGAQITDNYVHDNLSVGLWADTNNAGFNFSGNYISGNYGDGIIYEISYNAQIVNNTFVRNGIVEGPTNPGFPTGAVYISESGSDSRVNTAYNQTFAISGNSFQDNWSGVVLWENADRFCNSPANSSTGVCTLVNPSVVNINTCTQANIAKSPYFDDCRWKTQNVAVSNNTFSFTPSDVGSNCTAANGCGFNGLFSEYGSYPDWSPYQGTVVEDHITFDQNNKFTNNTYVGPWSFMAHDQSTILTLAQWKAAPYDQD
jgi:Right handed beta helix region